ncbi:uncharacterized protein MONOS_4404 [Monocercomonoides exilis]|uniref:uncharacterized protein n=1 Tax=Monocercomonoides exilis TaxID=2049356 RepID=UPI00355AB47C|nr:hypothetical protein MONOS_4404 [Monocercomonoides exilis]|eukprot:MONOS_4404.1-p1 / transcript=MONOS_4404.1 / gene=MONOS_4404 / organism=Monocercomonoides_exilis_PA203 / gene_product=unspecified product / transcript_product=unspecified product / location=Mono_scaffold00117:23667-24673(+) / protein_length=243 / sequence_SO=supercontig / SO=protein_coding / is_pseudo=false
MEVGKQGRPQVISKEQEKTVLDVIKIDSICGSSFTMKKTRELMENVLKDTKDENEPHIKVSNAAAAGFCKEAQRMDNATLVAAVAADGYSLPCIILWPSVKIPDELKPLLSPTLDIWPNKSGWMDKQNFKKYAETVLLPSIVERKKRMSLETEKCLLFIDSHPSCGDPTIWKTFSENNIDVITFISHNTHLSQPLDRGVFATLKTSLPSSLNVPSSTSSSFSRKALVDVLPQAIHSAFTLYVI